MDSAAAASHIVVSCKVSRYQEVGECLFSWQKRVDRISDIEVPVCTYVAICSDLPLGPNLPPYISESSVWLSEPNGDLMCSAGVSLMSYCNTPYVVGLSWEYCTYP